MQNVEDLIRQNKGTIIDVRTYGEFLGGHVAGSKNIPLHEIPSRIDELQELPMPLIFCCASGNRSGQATYFLRNQGIDCHNGGSWLDVNYFASLGEEETEEEAA